ncbi:hypothetical protein PT974_04941 [Cladobotryum mycophilum]|uniref:Heterokaryon incompatibility domain-containing protein n=1 Tax=Cladobotryum mycophilum TaxID=491253 RepID=A0ABR0SQL2_9HYPO
MINKLRDIPKPDGEKIVYDKKAPFWIDTLCCPARPSEGKKLAIIRMRETYGNASSVLVLSADLQTLDASELPLSDQVYLVSLSAWASRLWALQEGALSDQVCIQFRDIAINYSSIYFDILEDYDSLPFGWVNIRHILKEFAQLRGTVFRNPAVKYGGLFSITTMLALTWRTTSVREDEAICLASILGMDMARVVEAAPRDRMKAFWAHCPSIPMSLIFWKWERMDEPGFRWAPSSLLGILDNVKDFKKEQNARYTSDGLILDAFGKVLEGLVPPFKERVHGPLVIQDSDTQDRYLLRKEVFRRWVGERRPFFHPGCRVHPCRYPKPQSIPET